MIAVKIVDNRLEKVHFADIVKDAKLQAFLLLPNFEWDGMTSYKPALAAKYSLKWWSLKSNFELFTGRISSRLAGTLEAETSVSRKAECLLGIGEDKKVTFWNELL